MEGGRILTDTQFRHVRCPPSPPSRIRRLQQQKACWKQAGRGHESASADFRSAVVDAEFDSVAYPAQE